MLRNSPCSSWTLIAVILVGVLWHAPGFSAGLYLDDYLHQQVLEGEPSPMSRWSLYDFRSASEWSAGEPGASGGLPFWTSTDWSVRFFRPVTSAALVLEHALFGGFEAGYVAMGLGYFALTLFLIMQMLGALGVDRASRLLALVFMGASGSTVLPVEWLANRNSLFEVLFLVSAVLATAKGRVGFAFLLACLAVLSKESGVLGFLLVPMIYGLRQAGRWRPLAWTALGTASAYLVALVAAGFGTNSAFYLTPWREPLAYARRTLLLFAAGLPDLALPYPLDLIPIHTGAARILPVLGLVLGCLLVALVARLGRGGSKRGFLTIWLVCAIALQGSAPPSSRLLVVAAVPASALIAQAVRAGWRSGSVASRIAASLLFVMAGPMSGLATLGAGVQMARFAHEIEDAARSVEFEATRPGTVRVLVMQARNSMVAFGIGATRRALVGDDIRFDLLQAGRRGLRWTRPDERTFVFESLDEPFLTRPFELVYLSAEDRASLGLGYQWQGPGYSVEATGVGPGGGLRELTWTWEEPATTEQRFLVADGAGLRSIEPPAIGETLTIPAPSLPVPFIP